MLLNHSNLEQEAARSPYLPQSQAYSADEKWLCLVYNHHFMVSTALNRFQPWPLCFIRWAPCHLYDNCLWMPSSPMYWHPACSRNCHCCRKQPALASLNCLRVSEMAWGSGCCPQRRSWVQIACCWWLCCCECGASAATDFWWNCLDSAWNGKSSTLMWMGSATG